MGSIGNKDQERFEPNGITIYGLFHSSAAWFRMGGLHVLVAVYRLLRWFWSRVLVGRILKSTVPHSAKGAAEG